MPQNEVQEVPDYSDIPDGWIKTLFLLAKRLSVKLASGPGALIAAHKTDRTELSVGNVVAAQKRGTKDTISQKRDALEAGQRVTA
jgi:hypothetical protein